jgi:two-component system, LytTR family, response regulator LytT
MRVLVVEDEPVVGRRIARLTREILGAELQSIGICRSLLEAWEFLDQASIDVLLLDLNLFGRDGFDLLRQAVARSFHTIVISANADRAIEAFEHGVLDYIAKPFSRERLVLAFERARNTRAATGTAARVLAVRKRDGIVLVPVEKVQFIKRAGPYVELHLRDGTVELHEKSLEGILAILPLDFERTHKSYIVRLSEIVKLRAREGTRYELELRSGQRLPLGRTRYRGVRARLRV